LHVAHARSGSVTDAPPFVTPKWLIGMEIRAMDGPGQYHPFVIILFKTPRDWRCYGDVPIGVAGIKTVIPGGWKNNIDPTHPTYVYFIGLASSRDTSDYWLRVPKVSFIDTFVHSSRDTSGCPGVEFEISLFAGCEIMSVTPNNAAKGMKKNPGSSRLLIKSGT
jgi:hypothetical protein